MDLSKFKTYAEKLYNSLCDVFEYEAIDKDYVTTSELKIKFKDVPCRISYKVSTLSNNSNEVTVNSYNDAQSLSDRVKLFCSTDYDIAEGSIIVVDGVYYRASGVPAKYMTHQEIVLQYAKEYA